MCLAQPATPWPSKGKPGPRELAQGHPMSWLQSPRWSQDLHSQSDFCRLPQRTAGPNRQRSVCAHGCSLGLQEPGGLGEEARQGNIPTPRPGQPVVLMQTHAICQQAERTAWAGSLTEQQGSRNPQPFQREAGEK